ncbi:AER245Cp [Eremothecium gossypii ATCC 10895]|uniref:Protein BCP1 n=1 Tax=Eremothecium gossypii (strain ATCC 10895 / CBS 109.51 / FGSC 9923 / NRRL Y-1056) TaxID=284811 RepID=BCP1_EREGS|nr:AER245Cp [Eremothecium gossypii ATCC 10895]Q756K9.1 RecName: Full=Protein BCP1 [Eremothecium gossypii ATCC 10895]AAS52926.1 AER245Cp [Eremothecium gossypii ATCC 10895]AEY97234.1 FAER245Cp [Eremothecium gossypii FDAG1]
MVHAVKLSELSKRKRDVEEDSDVDISTTDSESDQDADGDEEIINIDFDFFNGNPGVDFHALKNLLRQLFGQQEANRMQLSTLADIILQSPTTTIKTDGQESDPYCFLSFVDYKEHRTSDYAKYLVNLDPRLETFFATIDNSDKTCALILCERLINMPVEVVPPLYNITLNDVSSNSSDGKHFDFYLVVSRKYEVSFDMDSDSEDESAKPRKRVKGSELDYFHEEDRHMEKYAKICFQGPTRKGVVPLYMVLDHEGLVRSIGDLEQAIASWK